MRLGGPYKETGSFVVPPFRVPKIRFSKSLKMPILKYFQETLEAIVFVASYVEKQSQKEATKNNNCFFNFLV